MSRFIFLIVFAFLVGCGHDNSFSVSRIINGNSIELENGSVVVLDNIQDSKDNMKILERYTTGRIQLYDAGGGEITSLPAEPVNAIVYNKDGDCLNELLKAVMEITKDPVSTPATSEGPVRNKMVISFIREDGVIKVRAAINGIDRYFVFDTGASLISISQNEVDDLRRQGRFHDYDIIGKGAFTDANGDISEGTIINLVSVEIGDRVVNNVKACVIHGQNVPLLLGLSAMEKFGRFSIDLDREQIVLD
jgi:aspartyl protease family protein